VGFDLAAHLVDRQTGKGLQQRGPFPHRTSDEKRLAGRAGKKVFQKKNAGGGAGVGMRLAAQRRGLFKGGRREAAGRLFLHTARERLDQARRPRHRNLSLA